MAYSENQLTTQWMPQIRFPNGANVNLMAVRNAIQEQCEENGIPVSFADAQLKVGGHFSKELEDILIMCNPEHVADYLRFAIRIKHQGKYAFMQIYNLGGSKNFKHDNRANFETWSGIGRSLLNAVGGHRAKLEAEQNYYTILHDCLENVIG